MIFSTFLEQALGRRTGLSFSSISGSMFDIWRGRCCFVVLGAPASDLWCWLFLDSTSLLSHSVSPPLWCQGWECRRYETRTHRIYVYTFVHGRMFVCPRHVVVVVLCMCRVVNTLERFPPPNSRLLSFHFNLHFWGILLFLRSRVPKTQHLLTWPVGRLLEEIFSPAYFPPRS